MFSGDERGVFVNQKRYDCLIPLAEWSVSDHVLTFNHVIGSRQGGGGFQAVWYLNKMCLHSGLAFRSNLLDDHFLSNYVNVMPLLIFANKTCYAQEYFYSNVFLTFLDCYEMD
ncbi:hypothetical protein TNCT_2331 [Trichonephila clavata]|uniref:Uncharacterized protein n=1 Tax=Trichonephila clavata TaxID=2740835 RepID=A0A8X6INF8_TRICU|nr:hypothetical protein TNCT_2331 [Trichonephila clavata]